MDTLLIDECLSLALVAVAHDHGHYATHVTFRRLNGTQDWDLMPVVRDENMILVTNNRSDFLKLYAHEQIHNGLIVIVPNVDKEEQVPLFEAALAVIEERSGEMVNTLVEVFADGQVQVREWSSDDHSPAHILLSPAIKPKRSGGLEP